MMEQKVWNLCLKILLVLTPLLPVAAEAASLKGQVLERGTKRPLKDVSVFILPSKQKATTDDQGRFVFENVEPGKFQFVVNLAGYEKFEMESEMTAESEPDPETLYVERLNYSTFETTIIGTKKKKDQSQKTLTQAEFLTLPGSGGDPVKAVQNLPGVNRAGGFSSQVVIQGAAPKDTRYDLDGHEIPLVFHFGGFSSVVMPEALESVDYFSAGYDAQYSRALGGIISLQTRKPDPGERPWKSFFFVDTLKAGALYEARIDEQSSYLISARHSYIGLLLGKIAEKNEQFNLTVVPEFSDFTAIYHRQIGPQEEVKFVAVASRDSLGFLLKEPLKDDPGFRGNFRNETIFYRVIPQWKKTLDSANKAELSVGAGKDQILADIGDQYFRLKSNVVTARGQWERLWEESQDFKFVSQFGFDHEYRRGQADVKLPSTRNEGGVNDPFSSGILRETSTEFKDNNLGLYARNEITTGRLSTLPSLRLDSFSSTQEKHLAPRLGFRYRASDSLHLKTAGGLYFQPPEPQETNVTFGNPDVKSPRAWHWTLGFEKDFRENRREGFSWNGAYFDRWFEKLVVSSSAPVLREGATVTENFNNSGAGRAYGVETQLKFTDVPYTGWVSYTWSKSQRWTPSQPIYSSPYDQTHNINLVASRDLPGNWKISGRFHYVTGNPYTPVVGGTFDSDNDVYIPKRGDFYSERFDDFKQLDLRFDKKWVREREIWTFYADIQNVWNQKNPENNQYSYDYRQREMVSGLPFLPSLGLKGEF